jgi:hypothetical protein
MQSTMGWAMSRNLPKASSRKPCPRKRFGAMPHAPATGGEYPTIFVAEPERIAVRLIGKPNDEDVYKAPERLGRSEAAPGCRRG